MLEVGLGWGIVLEELGAWRFDGIGVQLFLLRCASWMCCMEEGAIGFEMIYSGIVKIVRESLRIEAMVWMRRPYVPMLHRISNG